MILTVTPNPAIDRVLVVPAFAAGSTNRAAIERREVGGKGINVARHLAQLGCSAIASGFLGAGDVHGVVETLSAHGVESDFVRIAGEPRVNLKILDPATGIVTEINEAGPPLAPEAVGALLGRVRALAARCAVVVFSGSLPPGAPDDLYARAIALAAGAGARTILDATGVALRLGIAAGPDVVKPNRAEVEALLGVALQDEADIVAAAKHLLGCGARASVISLGSQGAVGASAEGVWRARAPHIRARNTVGAGDAMVAALACALKRSLPMPEALRLATALGSATAASDAPLPPEGSMDALLSQVSVESASDTGLPDAARIRS